MNIEKFDLINEENIYLTKYDEKASHFRARIADTSVSVEMKLGEILSEFFNQDEIKYQFMFGSIFTDSDLSFSSKAKILSELLENFYPDILIMFPGVIQDMKSIIQLRNRMDQSMLDSSQDFIKHRYADRILLLYFNQGRPHQMTLTDEELNSSMRKAAKVVSALDQLKVKLNLN